MGLRDGSIRHSITPLLNSPITRFLFIDFYLVDDADDGGVDRAILEAGRHPRGAAADDEHRLSDAGVDRVDRHQIVAFRLSAGIDRTDNEQLVADESWVLARGDDSPHDFGEKHLRLSPKPWSLSSKPYAFAVVDFPIGSASSRFACGRGMTWTETSSPTRRAAAAPASVAALTAATSPRTIAVT